MILLNFRPRTASIVYLSLWLLVCSLQLSGCDYARMTDDEAIDTHETLMPEMPKHTIPVTSGIEMLRTVAPHSLLNPLPSETGSIARGLEIYGYFCSHCHGPDGDGYGTVGQSFTPLPADLRFPAVQQQSDGELFVKISLGYRRHPRLASTVAQSDRWAVINYLRSLTKPPQE